MKKVIIAFAALAFMSLPLSAAMACPPEEPECQEVCEGPDCLNSNSYGFEAGLYEDAADHAGFGAGGATEAAAAAYGLYHAGTEAIVAATKTGEIGDDFVTAMSSNLGSANAHGDLSTEVGVNGETVQYNWITQQLPTEPTTYASGGDNSTGQFNGTNATTCPGCDEDSSIEGASASWGSTFVAVDQTDNTRDAMAETIFGSEAMQTGDGETLVAGLGGVLAATYMAETGIQTFTTGDASSCYEEQAEVFTYGEGYAITDGHSEITPDGSGNGYEVLSFNNSEAFKYTEGQDQN